MPEHRLSTFREAAQKERIAAGIMVNKNCYHNESDEPFPVEKYPMLLCIDFSKEYINFNEAILEWVKKKGEDEAKLRMHNQAYEKCYDYSLYFASMVSLRSFLAQVITKFEIEEYCDLLKDQRLTTAVVSPELLLLESKKYFTVGSHPEL